MQLDALHKELGEQEFAQLRATIEPQALSILEQGLLEASRDLSPNRPGASKVLREGK
jgi:hypothetical protein